MARSNGLLWPTPQEFSKGLLAVQIITMTQSLTWSSPSGTSEHFDELENAGSETGAQLRKMACQWDDDGDVGAQRPAIVILKMTDVTEVPQMASGRGGRRAILFLVTPPRVIVLFLTTSFPSAKRPKLTATTVRF